MLDFVYRARWDQAYRFLISGSPPVYVLLIAVNGLFFLLHAARKSAGSRQMSNGMLLFVQGLYLSANCLVLFRPQVEDFLRWIRTPF